MIEVHGAIFDLCEVLLYSRDKCQQVWDDWAAHIGIDPSLVAKAIGQRSIDLIPRVAPGSDVEAGVQWIRQRDLELASSMEPVEGARLWTRALQLLEQMKPGLRLYTIASSAERELVFRRSSGAQIALPKDDAAIIASEDVVVQKPEPEAFHVAARWLGRPPEECVVLEDNPVALDKAKRDGFKTVKIGSREMAPGSLNPDISVPDLAHLTFDFTRNGTLLIREGRLWDRLEVRELAVALTATDRSFPPFGHEFAPKSH